MCVNRASRVGGGFGRVSGEGGKKGTEKEKVGGVGGGTPGKGETHCQGVSGNNPRTVPGPEKTGLCFWRNWF